MGGAPLFLGESLFQRNYGKVLVSRGVWGTVGTPR